MFWYLPNISFALFILADKWKTITWFHDVQSPFLKNISIVHPFCLVTEITFEAPSSLNNHFLPKTPFLFIKAMMFLEGAAGLQEPHTIQMLGEKKQVCQALKY